ncbi:hypothetical protein [Vibrio anguillarum]|nr:hypothetical protein [Vibrio anguillarum]
MSNQATHCICRHCHRIVNDLLVEKDKHGFNVCVVCRQLPKEQKK